MPATTRPEPGADRPQRQSAATAGTVRQIAGRSLYTADQRARRDATGWTTVQAILAPVQFIVFVISLWLVLRYLNTGTGAAWATASVLLKTALLYTIMVTGCIWERVVFGQYLFAPAFFWEDVVSMIVIALHTVYLLLFLTGAGSLELQFQVALLAYSLYAINAAQFLWKLRQARLATASDDAADDAHRTGPDTGPAGDTASAFRAGPASATGPTA